jgi:hypothetical protein
MSLDLRIPMGLMFTLVGIILVAFGFATNGNTEFMVGPGAAGLRTNHVPDGTTRAEEISESAAARARYDGGSTRTLKSREER